MSIIHIPFYPSDWLAGTRSLSDAETGVYITLIATMYEMAAPIERNDDRLFRMCGAKSKASFVKSLNYLIDEGKILDTSDGLFNEKVAKVIKYTVEKSDKAKAAAQSRWDRKPNKNKGTDDADAYETHMPEGCHLKPEPKLDKKERLKPLVRLPVVVASEIKGAFDEFWTHYPRKIGKAAASKAFFKAAKKHKTDDILFGLSQQIEGMKAKEPQFIPHAATWLNAERWTDDAEQPHSPQQRNGASQGGERVDPALAQIARLAGLS